MIDLHDVKKVSAHSSLSDANAQTQPHTFLSQDFQAANLLLNGRADAGMAQQGGGNPPIGGEGAASGWMLKKGEYNPAFQSRYFVLLSGVLSWYRPEQVTVAGVVTGEPRGWIECAGSTLEGIQQQHDAQGLSVFAVQAASGTTVRRLELALESRAEAERWVAALGGTAGTAVVQPRCRAPSPRLGSARLSSKVQGLKRVKTIRMEDEDEKESGTADTHTYIVGVQTLGGGGEEARGGMRTTILKAKSQQEGQEFVGRVNALVWRAVQLRAQEQVI